MTADFTDDSSGTMGLGHSYRKGAAEVSAVPSTVRASVFGRGGDRVPPGEAEAILAAERDKREREIARLLAKYGYKPGEAGLSRQQAEQIVDAEAGQHGKDQRALVRAEKHQREIEDAMGMHDKPAKRGGGGGGRRKHKKSGTWVCPDCHLERCEHRPVKSKGGRPAVGGRSVVYTTHISRRARAVLAASDASGGELIEALVVAAVAAQCSPREIVAMLGSILDSGK